MRPPRGLDGWDYRRSARGAVSYSLPDKPEGVSLVSYSRTPDGDHRVRVEANLTTLLYGPEAAALSLHRDDLVPAVTAYLENATRLLRGAGLPNASGWDVHRMDPSVTYRLPEDLPTSDVIDAAWRAFVGRANGRQSVARHNGETVTFRQSKHLSWTVYDKTADLARKGQPAPANLLRMEARMRPRNDTSKTAQRPDLAAVDQMHEIALAQATDMLGTVSQRVAASSQVAVIRAMMRGGASLNTALRLASVVQLTESFGDRGLISIGGAESSVRRWKAEVRKYLDASGGEDALRQDIPALLDVALPMFARDFAVTPREDMDRGSSS